jgi:hypothetical protein
MWQHHVLVCALFLVQGGKWTGHSHIVIREHVYFLAKVTY